jgi:hypothetical protein
MKNIENKKTAVDLTDLAIGIIILGVAVSIGVTLLVGVRDSRLTDLSSYQIANETITLPTDGTLNSKWVKNIRAVTNFTTGNSIGTGNYTTSISSADGTGTIANTTTLVGGASGGKWNITYDVYNISRADWDVANDASIGLGEYGNWFKIIVIVGVAAVVLSLIFMAFGKNNSASGQSY